MTTENLPYISLDNSKNDLDSLYNARLVYEKQLFLFSIDLQVATLANFLSENKNIEKLDIWYENDAKFSYLTMNFFESDGTELYDFSNLTPELTVLSPDEINKIIDSSVNSFSVSSKNVLLDLYKGFLGPEEGTKHYNQKRSIEFSEKLDAKLENKTPVKSKKI